MKIQDDYLLVYARKDSQRLKDTFFSDNKEKRSKDNILLFSLIGIVIFCTIAGIILAHYDVMMLKRTPIETPKGSLSLIIKNQSLQNTLSGPIEHKGPILYSAMAPNDRSIVKTDFTPSLNIRDKALTLYTRCDAPVRVETVIKDSRFFSNSRNPIISDISSSIDETYTQTVINLADYTDNKLNLGSVQQVTFSFYPKNEGTRLFVKDIVVADKDVK